KIRVSDALLLIVVLLALPLALIAASYVNVDVERLRRWATALAATMLAVALAAALSPQVRTFSIRSSVLTSAPGGEALLRIDVLAAVLLPFAASLWLLTVAVTPRGALDRGGLRRTALATLITVASFLTESAV